MSASAQAATMVEPVSGVELIRVEGGCFDMGSADIFEPPPGTKPRGATADESPLHRICVDSFWIGRHEVTRSQWQRVMGNTEAQEISKPDWPATHITIAEAEAFIEKINTENGTQRFRLPTEAEWEYACVANSPPIIPTGLVDALKQLQPYAWYQESKPDNTQVRPVAKLKPNSFGLYDMLGNVWELTQDSYKKDGYEFHDQRNPGITGGTSRVIRGASYRSERYQVRCQERNEMLPGDRLDTVGFRLVSTE